MFGNVRQQGLADEQRSSDVDVQYVVIVNHGNVLQSVVAVDTGIVDEDVDLEVLATESLFTGAKDVSADVGRSDVSFDNVGFGTSAQFDDVVGHLASAALAVGRHVVL